VGSLLQLLGGDFLPFWHMKRFMKSARVFYGPLNPFVRSAAARISVAVRLVFLIVFGLVPHSLLLAIGRGKGLQIGANSSAALAAWAVQTMLRMLAFDLAAVFLLLDAAAVLALLGFLLDIGASALIGDFTTLGPALHMTAVLAVFLVFLMDFMTMTHFSSLLWA